MPTESKTGGTGAGPPKPTARSPANPVVALFRQEHERMKGALDKLDTAATPDDKRAGVAEVCSTWTRLSALKDVLYPTLRDRGIVVDMLDEAEIERDITRLLISEVTSDEPEAAHHDAKARILSKQVRRLIQEEEKPKTGFLTAIESAEMDWTDLEARLRARLGELTTEGAAKGMPGSPVLLHSNRLHAQAKESETMARQSNVRERDREGRFVSDDDDGGRRRAGGRERDSRGRFTDDDDDDGRRRNAGGRERDDRGRFTDDDDDRRRPSVAGRERDSRGRFAEDDDDDDRGSRRRSSASRERDDQGRFMSDDDRGNGQRSYARSRRDDDDDDRGYGRRSYSRSRSDDDDEGRGWHGDPEGHAEAARRGWEDRRSSSRYGDDDRGSRHRSDDDDDRRYSRDRGHGGWYGDPEGHSEAARRGRSGDDNSRRSRSSSRYEDDRRYSHDRGHGGWFGDPEGHAEASRRGWEERQSTRSGRRSDDEDDDDGRRGRSPGGARGGWSGDPEGHAEAARRGWESRRD